MTKADIESVVVSSGKTSVFNQAERKTYFRIKPKLGLLGHRAQTGSEFEKNEHADRQDMTDS